MHGLRILRGASRRRLRDERGWALVDAMASAVVVVLAFVGTTMAFNGSTASVVRDQKKTQAMIVAQNSINEMRGIGQTDINDLLALDNTTKNVVYNGTTYTVAYDAYYVTGLGTDQQDACQVSYSSGGGTARYIYMRVKVTYAGQINTVSGGSDPYTASPASLDSYYSPEGGGVQVDTGTLRIYVLDRNNNPISGIANVKLYVSGQTGEVASQVPNSTTGCVLFTGLVRNTYVAKVTTNLQDLYLTNSSSLGTASLPVVMPDRGALSREIRLSAPVTVTPKFYTNTGSQSKYEVKYSSGKTNTFFGGSSTTGGSWIAGSDQIKSAPSTDFSYLPTGISFMPHLSTVTASSLPNAMFPLSLGYSAYAGPCDANDPNAGVDEFTNNYVQVPTVLTDSNWVGGGSYTPELWLSQIRTTFTVDPASKPTGGYNSGTTYYYNQAVNGGASVWVKLKADYEGGHLQPRCRSNFTNFDTWVNLGSISAANAYLSDEAEALPVGTYDVCVKFPYSYKRATASSSGWPWYTVSLGSESSGSGTAYMSFPDVALGYRSARTATADFAWPSISTQQAPSSGDTTDCTA